MKQSADKSMPNDTEICAMAGVLIDRYGDDAGQVAHSFRFEHEAVDDLERAEIWRKVCDVITQVQIKPTLS